MSASLKPLVYGVIYTKFTPNSDKIDTLVPDGAGPDVEGAESFYQDVYDEDCRVAFVTHTLNVNDYWRGWFFYNDMEDEFEAGDVDVNSREHLDAHWEANNSSGHYDCVRYEHIVDGKIIETIQQQELDEE